MAKFLQRSVGMDGPWRYPFEVALERNAPQREVQVATVSPEGWPFVRTVDFRGLAPEGTAYFFTDARSRKADHLRTTPRLQLHAFFQKTQEQFRLSGRATLHGAHAEAPWDTLRTAAWQTLADDDKRIYLGPPPGYPAIEVGALKLPTEPPPEFLVVSLDVTECDWLSHGPPRRRLQFRLLGPSWVEQGLTP